MNLVVQNNVPLALHTTLKTGGVARYFATVSSRVELEEAVSFASAHDVPIIVIGRGSNLLVSDGGYEGLVIKMEILGRDYESVSDTDVVLTVGAGEELDAVVEETVNRGYFGLENLSAIPGTVGATPVQNVGAYGVEVKDIIKAVEVFHLHTKKFSTLSNSDCNFGYRDSLFKSVAGKEYVIVTVQFNLSTKAEPKISYRDLALHFKEVTQPTVREVREAVVQIRAAKFPDWRVLGTAGSFFKNPIITADAAAALKQRYPDLPTYLASETEVKVSLGYVLDKICSLKGYRHGAVGLYEAQALVLVNYGGASAADILSFVNEVKNIVREKTEIEIEREVQYVGE